MIRLISLLLRLTALISVWAFVNFVPTSAVASTIDNFTFPVRVGFIRLGETTIPGAERRLGFGLISTGYHSGGARYYHVPGGCMIIDGWAATKDDEEIIDTVTWATWSSPCQTSKHRLTFHGLALWSPKSKVILLLGSRYQIVNAYSQQCFEWQYDLKDNRSLTIDANFAKERAILLSIMYDNGKE